MFPPEQRAAAGLHAVQARWERHPKMKAAGTLLDTLTTPAVLDTMTTLDPTALTPPP
jgi:hypothetical protein